MSSFWILVPIKDTQFSKQRLAGTLNQRQRQALMHVMLEDVLSAIAPLASRAPCVLVTIDPFAQTLADQYNMRTLDDGALAGHTGAVDGGRKRLADEGAGGFLTMPGDIPLVTTQDIAHLLDVHNWERGFTISPAADEMGSNAIACSPPLAVPLRFGDNSFFPHLDAARQANLTPNIQKLAGFATDVDAPADIKRLLAADPQSRSRTARFLRTLDLSVET